MVTSQGGDLSNNTLDFYNFGVEFARSDLFSLEEKHTIRSFCIGYIAKLMGIIGQEKEVILGYEEEKNENN